MESSSTTVWTKKLADTTAEVKAFSKDFHTIIDEIGKVIVGNEELVRSILIAFFCGGHVLIEGLPGLGKTLLVKSLSKALGFEFKRIQFTPDLMPADIIGTQLVIEREDGRKEFKFSKGPIFANIILADEVNRATPKTQSALLEAMGEHQVTVAGNTNVLEEPFFVLATQNPIEMEGTYPLPEAQMDRFFFKLNVPYPSHTALRDILSQTTTSESYEIKTVFPKERALKRVLDMRRLVRDVLMSSEVQEYIVNIVMATQPENSRDTGNLSSELREYANRYISYGTSPRGGQAIVLAAKATALLDDRINVSFEDVDRVVVAALNHRILVNFEAEADKVTTHDILKKAMNALGPKE
ncbi:MAG TPA: AAA family ATPase [Candidatus Avalokitesvara rifleensis]|uniref:AAA family ATPase n=1 Tax=Candidatus Avalokitesvara rifleensis TaxID=3367620 RepID=UPI0027132F1F|nr:MoxR family ATPase [Candidatus Brocadiales bacterium]